jgi:hypothetical protein
MVGLAKTLQHWQQQIFTTIRLVFFKFIGIFSPLFWHAKDNTKAFSHKNGSIAEPAAEEQQKRPQKRLELSLEMHNELILFATRETLATLVELSNRQSYIGNGVALLADKRLQSIRVGLGELLFNRENLVSGIIARFFFLEFGTWSCLESQIIE